MKLLPLLVLLLTLGCESTMDTSTSCLYAANDLLALKRTNDSLYLRYLQRAPKATYHSWPQTQATVMIFTLPERKMPRFEAQLKKNTTVQQLSEGIPEIKTAGTFHQLLARYNGALFLAGEGGISRMELTTVSTIGQWMYTSDADDDDDSTGMYHIRLILPEKPFARQELPQTYAKMLQYVDVMMDTNTVFTPVNTYPEDSYSPSIRELLAFVHLERNVMADSILGEADKKYIHDHFRSNLRLRHLLNAAVKEAIDSGNGGGILDRCVQGLYPKDTLLRLKCSYTVTGNCGYDPSPLMHAQDIAVLASQAHNLPVFIKAHLNILDVRLPDGCKAELYDLAKLDIRVQQLLLGSVLQADRLPAGHYYGNSYCIAETFTASTYGPDFEKQVKTYMKDDKLDLFNRYLFYLLYTRYCDSQQKPVTELFDINHS